MSPARLLLAGTAAGYFLARAEPRAGVLFLCLLTLSAALGAVAVVWGRP